jgi:hypothetical protein
MAVRTGISPLDLLKTPPTILAVMVRELWPDTKTTGGEAWQQLAAMATA